MASIRGNKTRSRIAKLVMERTDHIVLVGGQGNDGYEQAGDLFRLMTPPEKKALIGNLAGHVNGVPQRFAKLQI